jgi:flagellar protein FliS
MLYDGAIRFLNSAIKELNDNNDITAKANLIEKTVKILEYLQSCLDNEKGGEIADNLGRLYDYMSITLTRANLKNDIRKMEEVLKLLSTIREGWNGMCESNNGNGSTSQPAAYGKSDSSAATESPKDRKAGIKISI